jgi:nucleoside-diphosphate-sugar epimerase
MTASSYTIAKSKPVLVTGAAGYIAGVLIKELLDEGPTIHATVRDAVPRRIVISTCRMSLTRTRDRSSSSRRTFLIKVALRKP